MPWNLKKIIVNIGSGSGLVPLGNNPLPEQMVTKFIWRHRASLDLHWIKTVSYYVAGVALLGGGFYIEMGSPLCCAIFSDGSIVEIYTGLYFMACLKKTPKTSFSFRWWADDVCDGSRHRNETWGDWAVMWQRWDCGHGIYMYFMLNVKCLAPNCGMYIRNGRGVCTICEKVMKRSRKNLDQIWLILMI